jgi:hypothetical protein
MTAFSFGRGLSRNAHCTSQENLRCTEQEHGKDHQEIMV